MKQGISFTKQQKHKSTILHSVGENIQNRQTQIKKKKIITSKLKNPLKRMNDYVKATPDELTHLHPIEVSLISP